MRLRAITGFALFTAFLAALSLASAPRLHEQLHPFSAHHECAATMIAAGNYEHSATPSLNAASQTIPGSPALLASASRVSVSPVPSSILEHAPPLAS